MKLLIGLLCLILFGCSYEDSEYAREIERARQKIIKIKNSNEEEYIKKEMIGVIIARCHASNMNYGNVVYTDCADDLVGRLK